MFEFLSDSSAKEYLLTCAVQFFSMSFLSSGHCSTADYIFPVLRIYKVPSSRFFCSIFKADGEKARVVHKCSPEDSDSN